MILNSLMRFLILTILLGGGRMIAAPTLPPGFQATVVVEEITAATALTIAPDGRIFYAEQTGAIRVVKNGQLLPTPAINLADRLDSWWERGLIGLTLHPDFPRTPYLYTVYVARAPHTHHVVSRFTVVGDGLDRASEMILLKGDDQAKLGGFQPAGHQGGPIVFGQDGLLYIGLGEQTASEPSQSLTTLQGKILRIRQDGSIPEDNPFYQRTEGKYRSIYAIGIRNPFGLAVDPSSGRLLEVDVGGSAFEEVNDIVAGANYGWPHAEGMSNKENFTNPIHAYPPAIGRSICGAVFYPKDGSFPDAWRGKLFIADWANHWLRAIDINHPDKLLPFGEGFEAPVALATAPDGSLYVLNRNTRWRDGKVYKDKTGSLIRIKYTGESEPQEDVVRARQTLAETGYFENTFDIVSGFHAFQLNAPIWQPGVTTRRWIRVPDGQTITTSATEHWQFPEDSVIIQHFDTTDERRFETHVYESNGDGSFRAAAYRWNESQSQAWLAHHSEIVALPGAGSLKWFSPGAEQTLRPELSLVGFVLQLNARQLHRGNQLGIWESRGWINQVGAWQSLVALDDTSASLEDRVRSYLDANCASCHRPDGPSRGFFDARYTTSLPTQNLLRGKLMAGDLGIADAQVIVPGSPEKSVLYQRTARHDAYRMPPVAVNQISSPVLPLMRQWIAEMNYIILTEGALDESADDLPAYKIETPSATYYLEKTGAGLSSLIDRDGNDWLGFHPEPGSDAGGEYRGFPNAVHQQAGNYFHAKNDGTDPSTTNITRREPNHITITAEGHNGKWACRYDFYPTHCTFTMTKMPVGFKYWTLYEGIPGGDYDNSDWWMTSAISEKQPLTVNHDGDIPAPEWIAFGDPKLTRSLYLYHHEDDTHPDRFYQMHQKMTVFGFGRQGIGKYLDHVPQSISIGLLETDDHEKIGQVIEALD